MKKVAVFGNTGGGKSTLSKRLSEITGLPLHVLDKIRYQSGGTEVPHEDYKRAHQQILLTDQWIIDGFGCIETVWLRLNEADSLIFVDLPLYVHFWWVTKRLITGSFKPPEGWPEKSPILKSSINSYRVLWLCHKYLTPRYREYIEEFSSPTRRSASGAVKFVSPQVGYWGHLETAHRYIAPNSLLPASTNMSK